ncbi:MAG: cell division protein FtsX [Fidelibacterota bacterium]
MDKFIYLLSEGFRSLWRAKLSAFSSITAIGVTLSFIGFGAMVTSDLARLANKSRADYSLEVFFTPLTTDTEAQKIIKQIVTVKGVREAILVTKQDAAEIFQKEFGENIYELLDDNPLPTSCTVKLEESGTEPLEIEPIVTAIETMERVEKVRYPARIITIIENYYQGILSVVTLISLAILMGTTVLVSNTIRLTIYSRKDLIRILKLVGATNRFIRMPFVVEGIIEGLAGGVLASILTYVFFRATNSFLELFTQHQIFWNWRVIILLIMVVVLFSILGSRKAVQKLLT